MSVVIDLRGPQGNAYALMATAQTWCRQLGKDPAPIIEEMQSKDYNHLLSVFEREFKYVCTLINKPDDEPYEDDGE